MLRRNENTKEVSHPLKSKRTRKTKTDNKGTERVKGGSECVSVVGVDVGKEDETESLLMCGGKDVAGCVENGEKKGFKVEGESMCNDPS